MSAQDSEGHGEEVFRDRLQSFFLSPEDVRQYLEAGNEALIQKRALLTALQTEESQVKANMDKTYRLYLDGVITTHGFGDRYGPLEARMKQLSVEIPRLQGEADFLAIQHLSSEEVVSQAQDVYGGWDALTGEEKRGIVEHMVERVTVSDDSVSIELFNFPAPPQTAAVGVHNHTVAYPDFRWKLQGRRYPASLEHIGRHILKRRLDVGSSRSRQRSGSARTAGFFGTGRRIGSANRTRHPECWQRLNIEHSSG
jgi:hypothetical protein